MTDLRHVILTVLLIVLWSWSALAFETAPVIDNCNRVENPLASGWAGSFDPDFTINLTANGTVCIAATNGNAAAYWNTIQPADMALSVTASDAVTSSTHVFSLAVRLQQPSAVSNTADYYRCVWAPSSGTVRIDEVTNGASGVTRAGPLTSPTSTGDELGCQIVGDTISLWQKPISTGVWTLLLSATDTSIAGPGYVGIHLSTNQVSVDNIRFGAILTDRIGLHVTGAQQALWAQRVADGTPYADDWTRILGRANTFVATPTGTWTGNQLNVAWNGTAVVAGTQPPNVMPDGGNGGDRTTGDFVRDAGFVYAVTGDTSYRDPVLTLLLTQAAISGTTFANPTKWSVTYTDASEDFEISVWLRKLVYAYSYIRPSISSANQVTLDTWFDQAATYWALVLHNAAKTRFPNRLTGDYTMVSFTCVKPVGGSSAVTHFGGYAIDQFGFPWNNKRMNFAAMLAAVGATTSNSTLISDAKRMFKEWLRSNIFPDGTSWEQARWTTGNPQSGFNYAWTTIGSASTIADHVARTGDTELYTYTTSEGNCGSEGGPKSLLQVLQRYANITLGNTLIYASLTSTSDPNLLIDSSGPGGTLYNDVNLAQPNVYYRDPLLTSSYTRTMPSSWNAGGYDGFGGNWGHLPAARFMFGGMEGLVWPYGLLSVVPPPPPFPGILLLPAPVQVGSVRSGGSLQGGARR